MIDKTRAASGCGNDRDADDVLCRNDSGACCIDTYRIYDSCRAQECIEDLRVFVTDVGQEILNNANAVRVKSCRILWTQISTEEMAFNHGYFQIDIRYYFYLVLECCLGFGNAQEIQGLAIFDKTVILYGGESNISIFQSDIYQQFCTAPDYGVNVTTNLPRVIVEAADPVALKLVVVDGLNNPYGTCPVNLESIPASVCSCFNGSFCSKCEPHKNAYITLGMFSVVRVERPSQLVIPACDLCIPEKICDVISEYSDPCTLFRSLNFPISDFYPSTNATPANAQTLCSSRVTAEMKK
ncbi:hypothetical protein SDC9_105447 [bioreactor metagenome]|uniref:Uncharacterized protein n=1 Tax=bioreactor metagenome TaxID=1076179 RepID=A0A645AZF8_9ZZZZ|nr:hypothetical protein [Oscillospiraceae bacterium]